MQITCHRREEVPDRLFWYAVILSRHQNLWVFCRHRLRDTWEIPGGHREEGESVLIAAERELFEETGALRYRLTPVFAYSVPGNPETFGMLYFADIAEFSAIPAGSEIAEIRLFDRLPDHLTYPQIQAHLFEKAVASGIVR